MNILFGIITTIASVAILWALYFCVPSKHRVAAKPYFWLATIAVACLIAWSSLMTYGPRVSLSTNTSVSPPEKVSIAPEKDIFDSEDKWQRLDKAAKKHEERQKQD